MDKIKRFFVYGQEKTLKRQKINKTKVTILLELSLKASVNLEGAEYFIRDYFPGKKYQ